MAKTNTPLILISGATGNVGREITTRLSSQKIPFRAMVRSRQGAEALAALEAAEVVVADFNDAASLTNALVGIDQAFLLTNSSEQAEDQQRGFVDVAKLVGVKHIVKLSQWAAATDSPVRFLRYHAAVEQHIRESGMAYTFLRPNLFMQGLLAFREQIIAQGKFFAPAGDAKISVIDVRDIAAVAVAAMTGDSLAGRTYDLTGPEALTHAEMAQRLSKALGRTIEYIDVTPESMMQSLLAIGLPRWQVEGVIEDYAHYRRGEASSIASGVQLATGVKPHSFDEFAHDYAPALS